MAQQVVVEGSLTPCVDLPKGERRTVELTPTVRRRIARGYYLLIEATEPVPVLGERVWSPGDSTILPPLPDSAYGPGAVALDPLPPPAKNASRKMWADYLAHRELDFPDDAGRDELVELWENRADGDG